MPSRSLEYPTQASSYSTRDMEGHQPTQQPSLTPNLSSDSILQLPPDNSTMGLATYSHDRNNELTTRSFHFRDEQVHSLGFNSGYPSGRDRGVIVLLLSPATVLSANHPQPPLDLESNCTSFNGLDSVQSPSHIMHCYRDTNIDRSAQVFNGDIARAYDSSSSREHHLHGGSVRNNSRLVNGDLDRDTFLAFFCNSDDGTRQGAQHQERARHRRRGPRAEGRTGPQRGLDRPPFRGSP